MSEREENLEWNETVLELFDDKSGSTLKEISFKVKREEQKRPRRLDLDPFITTLLRSNGSFLSLSLVVGWKRGLFEKLAQVGEVILPSLEKWWSLEPLLLKISPPL